MMPRIFAVGGSEILGGDAGGGAGAQAAQVGHVDDPLNAALAAVKERDDVGAGGVGAQADQVGVLIPGGHHVELLGAALEAAARHVAHFTGGAVAKHFVDQVDGLGHVDEFTSLCFADDHCHG